MTVQALIEMGLALKCLKKTLRCVNQVNVTLQTWMQPVWTHKQITDKRLSFCVNCRKCNSIDAGRGRMCRFFELA